MEKPRIRVKAVSASQWKPTGATASVEVETAHHTASVYARDMRSWPGLRMSPDAALLSELDTIVGRIDDLTRNNGVAAGAERTFIDNVIGPRLNCKPMPNRFLLGKKSPEWLRDWQRQVEGHWQTFADTNWFDAGLRYTFHDATRMVARSIASSGEALALPLWVDDDSMWRTRIMLVDPVRLSTPLGAMDGPTMRGGIEMDGRTGAPKAYHVRKAHPNDAASGMFGAGGAFEWDRIPAYWRFGRARVLHVYDPERIGQSRGKPIITAVARQFKMLDHYHREALRQAILDTLVFGSIETPLDQRQLVEMFAGADDPAAAVAAYQDRIAELGITMQGGTLVTLPPGTKINPFAPQRGPSQLDTFTTTMLRHISTGLNMPYELVFRDFSKTNYSSARAALLEAWRYFATVREFVSQHWATPVYDLWFEEAVHDGKIPDCTPDQFYANRVAWTRCKWIGSGRGWIDPLKEANAAQVRLSMFSTVQAEAAEQGLDWTEQMEQRAIEKQYAAELKLPDPHVPPPAGRSAASPETDEKPPGGSEDDDR